MTFRLAGLLRVREAQERIAAQQLSQATAERVHAQLAHERTVADLAQAGSEITDARTLMAMAAARAAGRSALSELRALVELRSDEEAQARAAHVDARRQTKALERLESAHRAQTAKARLDAEQKALDEAAARVRG